MLSFDFLLSLNKFDLALKHASSHCRDKDTLLSIGKSFLEDFIGIFCFQLLVFNSEPDSFKSISHSDFREIDGEMSLPSCFAKL